MGFNKRRNRVMFGPNLRLAYRMHGRRIGWRDGLEDEEQMVEKQTGEEQVIEEGMTEAVSAQPLPVVMDVDEQDFERDVVVASSDVPIVVDFWAPWCGPCRMLGPVLEKLAEEGAGIWRLVKVNVDNNQGVAQNYEVQGIPAVLAFRDGEVVDAFIGAQPEPLVRQFLEGVVPPQEIDAVAEEVGIDAAIDAASAPAGSDELETEIRERLDGLMAVLDRGDSSEEERKVASAELLEAFTAMGDDHDFTREYRKRMASLLW